MKQELNANSEYRYTLPEDREIPLFEGQIQVDPRPIELQKEAIGFKDRHPLFATLIFTGENVDRSSLLKESGEIYGITIKKMLGAKIVMYDDETDTYYSPPTQEQHKKAQQPREPFKPLPQIEPREGRGWLNLLKRKGRYITNAGKRNIR